MESPAERMRWQTAVNSRGGSAQPCRSLLSSTFILELAILVILLDVSPPCRVASDRPHPTHLVAIIKPHHRPQEATVLRPVRTAAVLMEMCVFVAVVCSSFHEHLLAEASSRIRGHSSPSRYQTTAGIVDLMESAEGLGGARQRCICEVGKRLQCSGGRVCLVQYRYDVSVFFA